MEQGKIPEMSKFKTTDRVPNPRVITLSPSSLRLLGSVGALEIMNRQCITPFERMYVNEKYGSSYLAFSKEDSNSPLAQL